MEVIMKGKLYGIGIGPGDPELLTLKAVRLIRESSVVAVPGKVKEDTVAYKIVKQAIPELDEKEFLCVHMPMTKDPVKLQESHDAGAKMVTDVLDAGKDVAFLTLGDPTVYATYLYIHKRVEEAGYDTEIISGITSFCAVAAKLNIGLVEKAEPLHVIPASYQIDDALKLPGTKVLMKAGKQMAHVKEVLKETGCSGMMVENCVMPNEKVYRSIDEINEDAGYYSVVIVKEK
jgi:precorrin-2/cobalt-factor-2 C20-methyltransferase